MIKFVAGALAGIILAGAFWFWIDSKDAAAPPPPPNWEDVMSEVKAALLADGASIEERAAIRIMEKKDITGDGFPEALIDVGSGGAYTSYFAVMQMKDGKPVLIQIKDRDNKKFALSSYPVGASAMHGSEMELVSNGVSLGNYSLDGTTEDIKVAECRKEVYVWNSASELFEWSQAQSQTSTQLLCSRIKSRF